MTVAEFLDWNDGTETRYELIEGRPVAMAPSAPGHSIVVLNLAHELRARLEAPCYVGNEAAVQHSDRDDTFYEADLVVSRTPVQPGMMAIPDPVVVIEVHSPSTIEHDRGLKAYDYRRIASVQEIVLVASAERRVEVWRRRGAKWQIEDLVGDAALELEAVQVSIPLAAVYANTGAASEQPAPAMPELTTRTLAAAADVIAPDGCEVRILASTVRGSMAHFTLLPGQVSRAVVHRTVDELWYFLTGAGRMWRRQGDREEITPVGPGVSLAIPTGTRFQLRNDGATPLAAVAVTMPPWPGEDEARFVEGSWPPTVG
jgi:mannose-6-phosphate isomerase-like protein (cupin superfamily)/Uma2 family endonuclease